MKRIFLTEDEKKNISMAVMLETIVSDMEFDLEY
jgi:hypothetical protein